jgi:hypothetical protein
MFNLHINRLMGLYMRIFTLIVFIAASALSCSKSEPLKPVLQQTRNNQIALVTEKGTAVRLHPFVYSSKVYELKNGEQVFVIEKSKVKAAIGKNTDFWYKIMTGNGLTGWLFGANIKIFEPGKESAAKSYETKIHEDEIAALTKELEGKWWSVNTREDFTNYTISLYKDGKYQAMQKDSSKPSKGTYTINPVESTITFSDGTPLGNVMKISERGINYYLEYADEKQNVRFKKISSDPKTNEEMEATDTINKPVVVPADNKEEQE